MIYRVMLPLLLFVFVAMGLWVSFLHFPCNWVMYVVMGLLTALAFFRHRANIMRLAKGTENRVYLGKKDKK